MHFARLILIVALFVGAVSCKNDNGVVTLEGRTELLAANNWRLDRINDTSGGTIALNRLGVQALALNYADIQFTSNNVARAIDRSSKQIINGGTWYLVEDNASLDVNVTGFKGIFPIIALSRTRFAIRQTTKVDGVDTPVNLEFVPAI
ncbi:hypothetical protein FAES_3903 [Fibrella aestuarina BUZ 2]|uniref:Lipocalin-like domain-containing protein n=1 Tax=Fibrella aestuarina BUZ 2 TaxID=1166018 RepID=I0KCQ6_9BACT|nr:hypothetical protein [Fibrella aestuarina]CCH01909.1 hypothetical protein FAES_3903 [Fibrella aestuarina BUZ 2]